MARWTPDIQPQIDQRRQDVTAIYAGTIDDAQTKELLKRYNVSYIYVGQAERIRHPAEGVARWDRFGQVVFQQGDIMIYRVYR